MVSLQLAGTYHGAICCRPLAPPRPKPRRHRLWSEEEIQLAYDLLGRDAIQPPA
ncbi:MAG: hypothetical protein U0800_22690 [Isosphaeraceae bacterium]